MQYSTKPDRQRRWIKSGLVLPSLAASLMVVVATFSVTPTAHATNANISHSYQSTATLTPGTIVSLAAGKSNQVEPSSTTNGDRTLGVVVTASQSLLAVNASSAMTQVATSGTVNTAVSDLNGAVKQGDQIAVSPFNGVGMKAVNDSGEYVVGVAQTALDTKASTTMQETVKDKQGANKLIHVGYVQINISPGNASALGGGQAELNGLQKAVKSITGKVIPTPRIVIALTVAVATVLILIALIYGAIYSAIISIGRNPLAKYAVLRTLGGVVLISLVLGSVAIVIILVLLR